jgi:poly(3-hydroxybutyrate) depolymerase
MLPLLLSVLAAVQDPEPAAPPEPIVVREAVAVGAVGRRARSAVYTDAVEAARARGTWESPQAGTKIQAGGEEQSWERVEADAEGWFSGRPFRGGWALARVEVPATGAYGLDLRGASMVLVDGEPRAGDVYQLGTTRIPLWLAAGPHELLFRGGRGRLRAVLEPAPAPVYLEERDRTLPDVLRGVEGELLLGHLVANATAARVEGLAVLARVGELETRTELPPLGPSSSRKCAIRFTAPVDPTEDQLPLRLSLVDRAGLVLHELELSLGVRRPADTHSRTFVSAIDGSVQYFAVTPPSARTEGQRPGLLLSLHGASVEARGQANSYAPKPDLYIVAPTNRRPYGFDWEDQGRLDAIEVLDLASALFDADPQRTWLTGHSMGGHGTWQIGAHFPDRFAAIAPSAGWRDFWSYAGGATFAEGDPIGALLARAVNPSRTSLLDRNYLSGGVYVLHGDADDNVPVREARAMRARLAEFHPNFAYYERPGAGHWWGNACVDWPPLFEFLAHNRLPAPSDWRSVEFVTVNPAVSSRCAWVTIEQQERWLEPSRVLARIDPAARRIELETDNIGGLALDLSAFAAPVGAQPAPLPPGAPVRIAVGGRESEIAFTDPALPIRLGRGAGGEWTARDPLEPWYKGPHRAGPFKDAFRNRMVFVHGTAGTPEENAWSYAKARYDHETWRYRGNGAVDLVADKDFDPSAFADRNVILYGHREMNAAWVPLLGEAAFDVRRGALRVGERELEGPDLALLAVHPRRDSATASVAVVAGTGLSGMRTTDDLPYFVSGVAYPDWTVFDLSFLERGLDGIRGAGFFRTDWSVDAGPDSAWRD